MGLLRLLLRCRIIQRADLITGLFDLRHQLLLALFKLARFFKQLLQFGIGLVVLDRQRAGRLLVGIGIAARIQIDLSAHLALVGAVAVALLTSSTCRN